mgnify:CR=1 FL=1
MTINQYTMMREIQISLTMTKMKGLLMNRKELFIQVKIPTKTQQWFNYIIVIQKI